MKATLMKTFHSGFVVPKSYTVQQEQRSHRFSLPVPFIITVNKVKNIDWTKRKPLRGGVIIYTKHNNKFLFCMAVDRKTSEITDFGGGISYRKDGNTVRGSLREFTEESLGVFGKIEEKDIQECIVAACYNMIIIFIPLNCDPLQITENFNRRCRKEKFTEVSALAWMDLSAFCEILYKKKLFYVRVTHLLQPVFPKILANL